MREAFHAPEQTDVEQGRQLGLIGTKNTGKTQTLLQVWAYTSTPSLYIDPPGAARDTVDTYNGQTIDVPRLEVPDDAAEIRDLWAGTRAELEAGRNVHWNLKPMNQRHTKRLLDALGGGKLQELPSMVLCLDEAHVYAGTPGRGGIGTEFVNYLSEARNWGHGICWATQRPAKIDATVEDETDMLLVFRLGHKSLSWLDHTLDLPLETLPVTGDTRKAAFRRLKEQILSQRPGEALLIEDPW